CGTTTNTGGASNQKMTNTHDNVEGDTVKDTVTIEFWYGLGGNLGDNMKLLIEEFNASLDEVIVKPVAQASYPETEQKLQAAIAAGNAPAVALSSNHDWAYS